MLAGAAAGLTNGFFGGGGGSVLVPMLTRVCGLDQRRAFATSVAVILPLCALSAAVYLLRGGLDLSAALPAHLKNGYVEKGLLFPAISAGLLCAALASWAATALDVDLLRKLFGCFLILIGLSELFGRVKEET